MKVIKILALLIIMNIIFQATKIKTQEFIVQIEQEAVERYIQEQKESKPQHEVTKLTPQIVNEYSLAQEGIRV